MRVGAATSGLVLDKSQWGGGRKYLVCVYISLFFPSTPRTREVGNFMCSKLYIGTDTI